MSNKESNEAAREQYAQFIREEIEAEKALDDGETKKQLRNKLMTSKISYGWTQK